MLAGIAYDRAECDYSTPDGLARVSAVNPHFPHHLGDTNELPDDVNAS